MRSWINQYISVEREAAPYVISGMEATMVTISQEINQLTTNVKSTQKQVFARIAMLGKQIENIQAVIAALKDEFDLK